VKLEIERRFLVEIPLKWYAKAKVVFADKCEIYQSYLKEPGERVRVIIKREFDMIARGHSPKLTYTFTQKKLVKPGVNEEIEIEINNSMFQEKLKLADQKRYRIEKTRYIIDFDKRKFELDIFKDKLLGLAILEIELEKEDEKVLLPPYFKVIREITNDLWYSNYNLATLEMYGGYGGREEL
jgi:CYTH domain-containing protein